MNDSPEDLAALVAEFGKAYTRRLFSDVQQAGTTPARARLLMALQCRGGCKMSELSAQLGVTPRNVTKLVDGLEQEGLVKREAHPQDRRATIVRLTDRGVIVCKETALANHQAASRVYERLPAEDRRHMARVLRKLLEVLAEETTGLADPSAHG